MRKLFILIMLFSFSNVYGYMPDYSKTILEQTNDDITTTDYYYDQKKTFFENSNVLENKQQYAEMKRKADTNQRINDNSLDSDN